MVVVGGAGNLNIPDIWLQPWPGQASAVLATPGFGIPKIFEANHVEIGISNL